MFKPNPQMTPSRRERGQSMVELALSFTILLILLAGVVDLGRAFFTYMTMRDAAQEGAAFGSLFPTDGDGIITRVRQATNMPIDMTRPEINVTAQVVEGDPCAGSGIRVDVYYDEFPMIMPLFGVFMGSNTIPLHAWVTDEILRPPCGD